MNLKQFLRPLKRNKANAIGLPLASGLMGAAIGGALGSRSNQKDGIKRKHRIIAGALIGGTIGVSSGIHEIKILDRNKLYAAKAMRRFKNKARQRKREWQEEFKRKWENSDFGKSGFNPPPPRSKAPSINHEHFFKEHGIDHTTITTKKAAKNHYRRIVMANHPDTNPNVNPNKIKNITSNWEGIENGEWFHKLASYNLISFIRLNK